MDKKDLRKFIKKTVEEAQVYDVHTHLYTPCFGDLLLYGIDELLTYHYLVAETFRYIDMPYEEYWAMDKKAQADLIWNELFIKRSPVSESCRGVLSVLRILGLDVADRDLNKIRKYFKKMPADEYVDLVFKKARIKACVMTNDPFDSLEYETWKNGSYVKDDRFKAALRIDTLLLKYRDNAYYKLKEWGYEVARTVDEKSMLEIQRFLKDNIEIMNPLYMAASLPPTFNFPNNTVCSKILKGAVLPVCEEYNIPFAAMIGVKKLTNPELTLAGDSVGKSIIEAVENLCSQYPKNKFMITMLARENQHELCVAARKFRNLCVFGCWWFLNNPSLIEEMTRMRIELLGLSMIPQHSDARVLDQLLYKWNHSKKIITDVLVDKYYDLQSNGWQIKRKEIVRDVDLLFSKNFENFLERKF